jgi:hypothetical protein
MMFMKKSLWHRTESWAQAKCGLNTGVPQWQIDPETKRMRPSEEYAKVELPGGLDWYLRQAHNIWVSITTQKSVHVPLKDSNPKTLTTSPEP